MLKLCILFLSALALGVAGEPRRPMKFAIPLPSSRLYDLLPEEDLSPLKDRGARFLNYGFGDVDQAINFKREAYQPSYRVRRNTPAAPPPTQGPVYTFVKTPQANFKWGVRHRAGAQYGKRAAVFRQAPEGDRMARQVIDLAAANGMDMSSLSGLPLVQNPGLARMARQVQVDQDSYQYAPIQADPRDDSLLAASGPPTYGPPAAAPHAGPDHVDYGAYTGGYGAFGWYTDHPVLLGPGHRRRRQAPAQFGFADDFQMRQSRFAEAARRRIQEEEDLDTAADAAYGAAPVGRVKIQVYRGPSKGDYDFAPWGYYNTQPADLAIHH